MLTCEAAKQNRLKICHPRGKHHRFESDSQHHLTSLENLLRFVYRHRKRKSVGGGDGEIGRPKVRKLNKIANESFTVVVEPTNPLNLSLKATESANLS